MIQRIFIESLVGSPHSSIVDEFPWMKHSVHLRMRGKYTVVPLSSLRFCVRQCCFLALFSPRIVTLGIRAHTFFLIRLSARLQPTTNTTSS